MQTASLVTYHRVFGLLGLAIIAACQAADAPSQTCGTGRVLTGDGIGALRVGASLDSVRAQCRVVSEDTAALGSEGESEHHVTVAVDSVALEATIVGGRIWRIVVEHGAFRTTDSIGVGSSVTAFRTIPVNFIHGEGHTFAVSTAHCGLSFRLARLDPWPVPDIATVADSVRVDRILVLGCDRTASPHAEGNL